MASKKYISSAVKRQIRTYLRPSTFEYFEGYKIYRGNGTSETSREIFEDFFSRMSPDDKRRLLDLSRNKKITSKKLVGH